MRDRATRRHAEEKKKAWAKKAWKEWGWKEEDLTPKRIGHTAHSPAMCSCASCGNQRKVEGDTIAERRIKDYMKDVMNERV